MKAIILAAGQGIRLGNHYSEIPKCLLSVGDKTILEWQLNSFSEVGINDISIVIGTKGECWTQKSYDTISSLCSNIVLNFNNGSTFNSYSTYLALRYTKETDILLIDGDIVCKQDLLEKILYSKYENIIVSKESINRKEIGCRLSVNSEGKLKKIGKNIVDIEYPWDIHSGIMKIGEKSFPTFFNQLEKNKSIAEELDAPIRKFIKYDNIYILKTENEEWVNINTQNDLKIARDIFAR